MINCNYTYLVDKPKIAPMLTIHFPVSKPAALKAWGKGAFSSFKNIKGKLTLVYSLHLNNDTNQENHS